MARNEHQQWFICSPNLSNAIFEKQHDAKTKLPTGKVLFIVCNLDFVQQSF